MEILGLGFLSIHEYFDMYTRQTVYLIDAQVIGSVQRVV